MQVNADVEFPRQDACEDSGQDCQLRRTPDSRDPAQGPHKACIGLLTQSAVTKCYIRTVRHELPDHLIIDRIEPYGDSR